jgi:hypothetical protein
MYFRPVAFTDTMTSNSSLVECINQCVYDSNCNYIIYDFVKENGCLLAVDIEITDNKNESNKVQQITYSKTQEPLKYYSQKCVVYNNKRDCNRSYKCQWLAGPQPYNVERAVVGDGWCGRIKC